MRSFFLLSIAALSVAPVSATEPNNISVLSRLAAAQRVVVSDLPSQKLSMPAESFKYSKRGGVTRFCMLAQLAQKDLERITGAERKDMDPRDVALARAHAIVESFRKNDVEAERGNEQARLEHASLRLERVRQIADAFVIECDAALGIISEKQLLVDDGSTSRDIEPVMSSSQAASDLSLPLPTLPALQPPAVEIALLQAAKQNARHNCRGTTIAPSNNVVSFSPSIANIAFSGSPSVLPRPPDVQHFSNSVGANRSCGMLFFERESVSLHEQASLPPSKSPEKSVPQNYQEVPHAHC